MDWPVSNKAWIKPVKLMLFLFPAWWWLVVRAGTAAVRLHHHHRPALAWPKQLTLLGCTGGGRAVHSKIGSAAQQAHHLTNARQTDFEFATLS